MEYFQAMDKKNFLAEVFVKTQIIDLFRKFVKRQRCDLRILAYHRIVEINDESKFDFDAELISATPSDFKWQMEHLKQFYNPITFADVIDCMEEGRDLPERAVIITFDDGFDDNYHQAFPILQELKIPATFFISTGYIGQSKTFWFDRVVFLLKKSTLENLSLDNNRLQVTLSQNSLNRGDACHQVLEYLKRQNNDRRLEIIDELFEVVGGGAYENSSQSRPMEWEHVQEMADKGMEIGSHCVSHPILSMLTPQELSAELVQSKLQIEKKINKPCQVISYPAGNDYAFNSIVKNLTRESNYKMGCSYINGINVFPIPDAFGLLRLHIERYTCRHRFESLLAMPKLFSC